MSNKPFDREIINMRERPLSSDIRQLGSFHDQALRWSLKQKLSRATGVTGGIFSDYADPVNGGFIGSGFMAVQAGAPNMTVTLLAGLGFQYDAVDVPTAIDGLVGLDDVEPFKPMSLLASQVINIAAADAANPRIDLIEVRHNRLSTDSTSRDILDSGTGSFVPGVVNKTLQVALDGLTGSVVSPAVSTAAIGYKQGVAAGVPVAPTVSPGYMAVAYVRVPALDTTIAQNQIVDARTLLAPGGILQASGYFTTTATPAVYSPYEVFCPPGMRIGLTRALAAAQEYEFTFGIIAGGAPRGAVITASVVDNAGLLARVACPRYLSASPTFLPATTAQQALYNAGQTQTNLGLAEAQQFCEIRMNLFDMAGAAAATCRVFWNATIAL